QALPARAFDQPRRPVAVPRSSPSWSPTTSVLGVAKRSRPGPATTREFQYVARDRRSAAMLAAVAHQADDVRVVSAVERQQADLRRQEGSRLGPARHLDRPVHAVAEGDLEERPHAWKLIRVNL